MAERNIDRNTGLREENTQNKQSKKLLKSNIKIKTDGKIFIFNKLDGRFWKPNGVYRVKTPYYHKDTGLGHNYEKRNVQELLEMEKITPKSKRNFQQNYVEYDYIKENEYTVTIEHCANCSEHASHTQHSEELYKNFALNLKKCILLRYPFIKVVLKPIDTNILKEDGENSLCVNDKFKEVRIGAMEIQICTRKKELAQSQPKNPDEPRVYKEVVEPGLIHSKLQKGTWPKIPTVLDQIASYLPKFNGEIVLFEKEDEMDESLLQSNEDNEENQLLSSSKIENLQVNIYLLRDERIEKIIKETVRDVERNLNPKMKLEKINEERRMMKENMNRTNATGFSYAGVQTVSSNKSKDSPFIDDKAVASKMKGKLLITQYTNEKGIIDFGPLPYDSYFIEVVESNQFMFLGYQLKFEKIEDPNKIIKKFLGLLIQTRAFLQLHCYETRVVPKKKEEKKGEKKEEEKGGEKEEQQEEEQVHIGGCKVTLKTCKSGDQANFLDDKEIKIKIHERVEGIFEEMVDVGRYLIEVTKDNYEIVRKYCDLEKGLNCINIEMTTEKNCLLKMSVVNLETGSPIRNAEIKIYKSTRELLSEGISDKKGCMDYLVTKHEDFLTVVVEKQGYFKVERIFIRNKAGNINEAGQYEEEMVFYLVKESTLKEKQQFIIVTYSSCRDANFELNVDYSKQIENSIRVESTDAPGVKIITYDPEEERRESEEEEDKEEGFEDVIRLSYELTNENLLIANDQDKGRSMNGIEKYCCVTFIYTPNNSSNGSPNNIFYLPSPQYGEENFKYWNLGWLDVKNMFFYEINTLVNQLPGRIEFFETWIDFLQKILDEQTYANLFTRFDFNRGTLINNDRYIDAKRFTEILKEKRYFGEESEGFEDKISDIMKSNSFVVSFNLFKRKITSNLKNFKQELIEQRSNEGF